MLLRVLRKTAFLIVVVLPIAFYVAYLVFFYNAQRDALFPGQDRPIQISDPSAVDVPGLMMARFPTALGEEAGFAWYIPPAENLSAPAPVVIIGHGNGEIADDWVESVGGLQERGYAILILGYPGYGHAQGSPSKESIVEAALGAYDWLVARPEIDRDRIIIFGHSIGGAAVLSIADQRPTQGAILLSAFASIKHIARDRYLPGFLAKDHFDNVAVLEKYDRPVYLMHGTEDMVVSPYQADLLHAAAADSQLEWIACGHGGCTGEMDQFWDKLEPIMLEMINGE